jgi:hypothetical protein
MEIKDKKNRDLIIGNYYRPSGSDKEAAQNVYADKDTQEKYSLVSESCSSLYSSSDVLVTFLQRQWVPLQPSLSLAFGGQQSRKWLTKKNAKF